MNKLMLDFSVGIFILVGIICISFLAIYVTNNNLINTQTQKYLLNANFDNIGSLKNNAPVKVSGFTIGRVIGIKLDAKTYQAITTLEITNNYQFSTDTSAQILTTGILGEQYIALQPGADIKMLHNMDTITFTSSAIVLENLIGKFMTNFNK